MRFSLAVPLPSSGAFGSPLCWTKMPLSCVQRSRSCWRRTRYSRSLQPRWGQDFTALTSSYPRKAVGYDQSWTCAFWTGTFTSSRSGCAEMHFSMQPSFQLVRSDRPEGRVLPCLDPPSIPVASCLHQGRGGSPCSIKGSRHSHSQLPQQLAHTSPVSSAVVRAQGHGAQPPQPVGASGQLGKEQTLPCAEDLFSRHGVGLDQPHSTSLSRAFSVDAELPGVFPAQEGGSTERVWEAPGAYGICSRSHAARIASYKTASALASRPGPEMGMTTRHVPGLSHPVMPSDLQPVVGSCFSSGRSS